MSISKTIVFFTVLVTIAIWSILAWQYYHGAVPSPHILHRKDLPAISNWWSGLLLPLLTWFLLYRIQKRLPNDALPLTTFYRFLGGFFFGIALSILFSFGYSAILGYMIIGLLLLGFFFPVYRAECLLGFVIGMIFTFGAVLPTAFGSILVLISLILYLYVRPAVLKIFKRSPNR